MPGPGYPEQADQVPVLFGAPRLVWEEDSSENPTDTCESIIWKARPEEKPVMLLSDGVMPTTVVGAGSEWGRPH